MTTSDGPLPRGALDTPAGPAATYDELAHLLRELAGRFGDTAFTDRRRLVSLLSDRLPDARREIRVVAAAVDDRVFELLARARPEGLGMEVERLAAKLENGLGIRSDIAIPVVQACAYALSLVRCLLPPGRRRCRQCPARRRTAIGWACPSRRGPVAQGLASQGWASQGWAARRPSRGTLAGSARPARCQRHPRRRRPPPRPVHGASGWPGLVARSRRLLPSWSTSARTLSLSRKRPCRSPCSNLCNSRCPNCPCRNRPCSSQCP